MEGNSDDDLISAAQPKARKSQMRRVCGFRDARTFALVTMCLVEPYLLVLRVSWVLSFNLDELHCGAVVGRVGCRVVACRRVRRVPLVSAAIFRRLVGWRQNFRCRRCAVVCQKRRIHRAVVQNGACRPNWTIAVFIRQCFADIAGDCSIWEAVESEILVRQERHRCDARDLKEERKKVESDYINKFHHQDSRWSGMLSRLWMEFMLLSLVVNRDKVPTFLW